MKFLIIASSLWALGKEILGPILMSELCFNLLLLFGSWYFRVEPLAEEGIQAVESSLDCGADGIQWQMVDAEQSFEWM